MSYGSYSTRENPFAGDRRPIYFVVMEYDRNLMNSVSLYNILQCIPATLEDVTTLYQEYVTPLNQAGHSCVVHYYSREPDNMLREMTDRDAERQ